MGGSVGWGGDRISSVKIWRCLTGLYSSLSGAYGKSSASFFKLPVVIFAADGRRHKAEKLQTDKQGLMWMSGSSRRWKESVCVCVLPSDLPPACLQDECVDPP